MLVVRPDDRVERDEMRFVIVTRDRNAFGVDRRQHTAKRVAGTDVLACLNVDPLPDERREVPRTRERPIDAG